jgi:hypothetical protein
MKHAISTFFIKFMSFTPCEMNKNYSLRQKRVGAGGYVGVVVGKNASVTTNVTFGQSFLKTMM